MTPGESWRRDAWILAGVGLVLRVGVALWSAERFPPADDGYFYHTLAQRLANGEGYTWLWPDRTVTFAAHYPVGYPALVAVGYALGWPIPAMAMLINALVGGAAVFCVHQLAASATSRRGALVAGSLCALEPGLLFYTPALMTEGVVAALLSCAAFFGLRARQARGRGRIAFFALCGLVLGAATLARPQVLLFGLLLGFVVVPAGSTDKPIRKVLPKGLLSGLGLAGLALVVCLPWTLRNCHKMDRCAFVSANAGWNLYIGAAPRASGSWIALETLGVPGACREVFGEASKDACLSRAAARLIRDEPLRWLGLIPRKLGATFNWSGAASHYLFSSNPKLVGEQGKVVLGVAEEVARRGIVALALCVLMAMAGPRQRSRLVVGGLSLAFLCSKWAFVGYLGLVAGAVLLGRRLLEHVPLLCAAGLTSLVAVTHSVFFGAGRYSLVLVPMLCAVAGSALSARGPRRETPNQVHTSASGSAESSMPAG